MKVEVLSESIWINLKLFKYLLELEFSLFSFTDSSFFLLVLCNDIY